jgi:hypothetical protein
MFTQVCAASEGDKILHILCRFLPLTFPVSEVTISPAQGESGGTQTSGLCYRFNFAYVYFIFPNKIVSFLSQIQMSPCLKNKQKK